MLITKEVEVTVTGNTGDYWLSKGYDVKTNIVKGKIVFPKGQKIRVKIEDLKRFYTVLVDAKCDYCSKIVKMEYSRYASLRGDTYCCPDCLSHKKKCRDDNGKLIFVEIPYRNKDWLYEEYIVKDREAQDIADECDTDLRTIRRWISEFNLCEKRKTGEKITKELLYDLYRVQNKTTLEIGEMFGLSDGAILYWLRKYGIPAFTSSEITRRYLYEKGGLEKARLTQSTMEKRIKSSCIQRGIKIEDFDGFVTTEQHMERNNTYYKEWRTKVFERDNYTCQCCGKHGGNLNAHHLYNFAQYPELKYDVDNGVTICPKCHLVNYPDSFHSLYGEKNNTPEQFYEYVRMKNNKTSEIKEVI